MRVVLPPRHRLSTPHWAALGAGAALLLAGCGAAPAPPVPEPAPAPVAASPGHGGHGTGVALVAVQSGPLGVVATDADGRILYLHTADTATASACTGACAQEWLPLLLPDGAEPQLLGVDAALVGTLQRAEGTQVTLAGHPLYHRADDAGGLADAGAHGRDGTWFAVTPEGEPVA